MTVVVGGLAGMKDDNDDFAASTASSSVAEAERLMARAKTIRDSCAPIPCPSAPGRAMSSASWSVHCANVFREVTCIKINVN